MLTFNVFLIIGFLWHLKHSFDILYTQEESYLKEFFRGIKETFVPRLYYSFFLSRRLLSVILFIVGQEINLIFKIVIFLLIHLIVAIYSIVSRPFKQANDNIVEIIHEISYAILICLLFHFNDKDKWDNETSYIFVFSLLGVSILTTAINLLFLIMNLSNKICQRLKKKNNRNGRVMNETVINEPDVSQVNHENLANKANSGS